MILEMYFLYSWYNIFQNLGIFSEFQYPAGLDGNSFSVVKLLQTLCGIEFIWEINIGLKLYSKDNN